jgi:hypothetical protein
MKAGFGPKFEMHFHVRQSRGREPICQKQSSDYAPRSRFGAFLRHAICSAAWSMSGGTFDKRTRVDPLRPHPPGTGEKMLGSSSTIPACSSGVSNSTPKPVFWSASVAKILLPTRKSAFPKCEPSTASGILKAIRRKSAAVIAFRVERTLLSAALGVDSTIARIKLSFEKSRSTAADRVPPTLQKTSPLTSALSV